MRLPTMFLAATLLMMPLVPSALAQSGCQSELQALDQFIVEQKDQLTPEKQAEAIDMRTQAQAACDAGEETVAMTYIEKIKSLLSET